MNLIRFIRAAGAVQVLIASANLPAARMFRYREHLRAVPPHVAEVFVVQNVFIVLTVLGMAAMSFAFAPDLAGGGRLGRALSGFLALFWAVRLAAQLFYYDRALRRQHRAFDVLFVAAFAYLVAVFAAAALVARDIH
jgi:hypothetical protein